MATFSNFNTSNASANNAFGTFGTFGNAFGNGAVPQQTQVQPTAILKDPLEGCNYFIVLTATISRNTSTWKAANGGNRLMQFHNGRFSEVKRGKAAGSYIFSTCPLPILQVDKKVKFKADGTPEFGNGTPAHAYIRKAKPSTTLSDACKFFLPEAQRLAKEIGVDAALAPLSAITTPDILEEIRNHLKASEGGEWDIKPLNWAELWKVLGYEFMEVALEGTLPAHLVEEAEAMKGKVRDRDGKGNYSIRMWFDVDAWKCIKDVETRKVQDPDGGTLPVDLINPNGEAVLRKVLKPTLVKIELVEGATIPADPSKCISPDLMHLALEAATKSAAKVVYATDDVANRKKEQTLAMPKKKWAWQTGFIGDSKTKFDCDFVKLDDDTFEIWCDVLLQMVGRKTLPPQYNKDSKLTLEWAEKWIEQVKEVRRTGVIPAEPQTEQVTVEVQSAPATAPLATDPLPLTSIVVPQTTLEAEAVAEIVVEETTSVLVEPDSTLGVHWGDDEEEETESFDAMDWSSFGVQ